MLDPAVPSFSKRFMPARAVDALYREIYQSMHKRWVESQPGMAEWME